MKKIAVIVLMMLCMTACGTDYNIDGTYVSQNGNKDFSVVICDGFCMIEVVSTNENGDTAAAFVDGKVTMDNDKMVITIDKDADITGTQFEFLYSERFKTLTNTSDGKVLKKEKPESVSPSGSYRAVHDDKIFVISFEDKKCSLTVTPAEDAEQYVSAEFSGSFKVKRNIITLDFKGSGLEDDLYRFVYEPDSDVLMNTSDGHIFEKTEEN